MRRRPLLFAALALVLAAPAHATDPGPPSGKPQPQAPAPAPAASWAAPQIQTVTAAGLMGGDPANFRPQDPLTRGALARLLAALTEAPEETVAIPSAPVTMAGLDSALVRALDLTDAASALARGARAAGLAPPSRFGTEVVARLLGLRTNHPAAHDDLELLPNDPATRAEAAFSAARFLRLGEYDVDAVREAATAFAPPALTPWQRQVLQTAVGLIGYPYVWGGTSEHEEAPFGVESRGGFDCSGFVWRVYKLQAYPNGAGLADTLRGRTTFAMSGEVPRAKRIPFARLQPGDVLFWGAKGPRSQPAQVDHTGIYVGNGWFIHSSGYGVALAELSGWYLDRFAWARRPLAEAGLD